MASAPTQSTTTTNIRVVVRGQRVRAYIDPRLDDVRIIPLLTTAGINMYRDWRQFRVAGVPEADSAICAIAARSDQVWTELSRLRTERPSLTLLVVTEHARASARGLGRVEVDEVLFVDEVAETSLAAALARVTRRTVLRHAADLLRCGAFRLDSELAETLARACRAQPAVRSASELVRAMGYSRSTLTRRWKRCTMADSHPHLFVDWLLVARSVVVRASMGDNWARVARALGVKPETLGDAYRRILGAEPSQIEPPDRDLLLGKLQQILGSRSPTAAS